MGCGLVTASRRRGDAYPPTVKNDRILTILALVLGVILIVVALVYWAEPADSLPGFFPGHSSAELDHHHFKHGIAAFLLGLACIAFAWFRSGPKRVPAST
jgi:hypothetical protein